MNWQETLIFPPEVPISEKAKELILRYAGGGLQRPPHLPVAPRSTAARAGNPTPYDAVVAAVGYDLNR